jgi:uncharacterized membrane protein
MRLSPEERREIYEEEKAKAEAEKPREAVEASTTKELKPNIAGLLCYVGGWITGIVFLILEKKNQFVRFHAMQSIVTFGALTIIQVIFRFIPVGILNWIVWALIIILWILLMYKAYQGQKYKLPVVGDIAEFIS